MQTLAPLGEFATRLREEIDFFRTHPEMPFLEKEPGVSFDRLAVSLFRMQFSHNAAYRRWCEACDRTPRQVTHWQDIPSVPASAFKEMDLSSLPPEERSVVFHSSGTSGQRPSRHFHGADSLRVYQASLWAWFAAHLLPEMSAGRPPKGFFPRGLMMLSPSPEYVPHSSLVHMFDTIGRRWEGKETVFVGSLDSNGNWTVDVEAAVAGLKRATELGQALLILGTAFSLVHLLDHLEHRGLVFELPAGSRVMETGGYKGRSRVLARAELHTLISRHLGVPSEQIVCEYGMSELSSQAYDHAVSVEDMTLHAGRGVIRRFRFPPWARAQIISPEHGREAGEGETGLIRVLDLANVYSVLAVQTEDLGIRRGEGFELIGRAQAAEPRGCSLAAA